MEQVDEQSAAFAVGNLIADKYVVERALGSGGLGVVVLARHRELGQRVAIKYLREAGRTNSLVVERFRREARIAAQICSEHVVRVQDVGEVEATPFIVMELLEGRDLGHVIAEGGTTTRQAVDYVLQACEGLAEIHAIGITHRDLKPENLFLVQDRVRGSILKIIDFGISKVKSNQANDDWAHVTSEGERFGTPPYMSPEQLGLGGEVDGRTDVWALGVVLFELLAGELPFRGKDVQHLFMNILLSAPTRPRSVVPGIPAGLEAAILRCLEKDQNQRFQNVAEFAQQLAPFGSDDARERVRRIEITLSLAGVDVRSCRAPAVATPAEAPQSLRPVALPTVLIPRTAPRGRRVRMLAPLCAAALGLGALVYASPRQDRARPAIPPPAALVAAASPGPTFLNSVKPTVTALQTAMESPAPSATVATTATATATATVSQPAAARSLSRSTPSTDRPVTTRTQGVIDRRALYGERK